MVVTNEDIKAQRLVVLNKQKELQAAQAVLQGLQIQKQIDDLTAQE
jgi:hypothetical protein